MDAGRVGDELEIAALLTKYARAVDTGDWVLYRSLFTEDAHIDYTAAGFIAGSREEAAEFLRRNQAETEMSMHYVMNVETTVDGACARTLAMWLNAVRRRGAPENSFFGGRWHHDLVRTPDGWRSRNLRLELIW